MLDVVAACYDNITKSCHTALCFVDLRMAFDAVSYEKLLVKLKNYGVIAVWLVIRFTLIFVIDSKQPTINQNLT